MTSRHPEPESGTAVFRLFPSSAGVAGGRGRRAAGDEGFDPEAFVIGFGRGWFARRRKFRPGSPAVRTGFRRGRDRFFFAKETRPLIRNGRRAKEAAPAFRPVVPFLFSIDSQGILADI
ncbi:MAG: hypothetical protein C6W56_13535 [Caldibacillus debilis]|nr:MAG: hypothetical protein C6W56_13535 [Caldibacillus debilis]